LPAKLVAGLSGIALFIFNQILSPGTA